MTADRLATMRKAYKRQQRQENVTIGAGCLFAALCFLLPAVCIGVAIWAVIVLVLHITS